MSVKKSVFADVEKAVSAECVLATNTSSLSITEMAADLEHPERVVGFHFFNPVAVMPLLEIVQGEQTDDATLATAFATGKALKKTTILVKDSPSFIVNRLLGRFMGEVGRIVDEGTPVPVVDGASGAFGSASRGGRGERCAGRHPPPCPPAGRPPWPLGRGPRPPPGATAAAGPRRRPGRAALLDEAEALAVLAAAAAALARGAETLRRAAALAGAPDPGRRGASPCRSTMPS